MAMDCRRGGNTWILPRGWIACESISIVSAVGRTAGVGKLVGPLGLSRGGLHEPHRNARDLLGVGLAPRLWKRDKCCRAMD